MTLTDQFNAFCQASQGKVGAAERGLYMTLLDIWNRLRRPEWFDVSNTQLQNILLAGSHHSVIRWRDNLEKAGFISSQYMGRGHPVKIHIEEISTANFAEGTAENALPSRAKNALVDKGTAENALPVGQKMPYSTADFAHITERDNRDISTTVVEISNSNLESIPSEVLKTYREEIRPVESPMDLMRMKELSEEHGADLVVKAIQRAAIRGKRSMGYVEAILRSWKQNGYDDEPEEGGAHGKRRTKQPARRLTPEEEQAKWEREAETQRRFREAQRRELGAGWDL